MAKNECQHHIMDSGGSLQTLTINNHVVSLSKFHFQKFVKKVKSLLLDHMVFRTIDDPPENERYSCGNALASGQIDGRQ